MFTVALSVLLLATDTTAPAPEQSTPTISRPDEAPKAEKKICKRERATESRMGSKRICLTEAQWKVRQDQLEDAFGPGAYK